MTDYQNIKTLIEENPYNETFCSAQGGSFYGHPKFAIKMLILVLLAMFFTLPYWWNNEKKTSKDIQTMTFILVVLQFYPLVEDVTSTLFRTLEKGYKVERGKRKNLKECQ